MKLVVQQRLINETSAVLIIFSFSALVISAVKRVRVCVHMSVCVFVYLTARLSDSSRDQTTLPGELPASLVYSAASGLFLNASPELSLCSHHQHGSL